jgi:hypothetical protein
VSAERLDTGIQRPADYEVCAESSHIFISLLNPIGQLEGTNTCTKDKLLHWHQRNHFRSPSLFIVTQTRDLTDPGREFVRCKT